MAQDNGKLPGEKKKDPIIPDEIKQVDSTDLISTPDGGAAAPLKPADQSVVGTGLVDSQVLTDNSASNFTPTAPGAPENLTDRQPVTMTPTENATVEGRLNGLMDKDSRLMQLSRTSALQQANSRGMINSTLAVGASQDAAIKSMLPIAQQDAGAYFQAERANQDAGNKLNTNEQAYDINSSLKEQEQRQYLDRLEFDSMNKEDQARLDTQLGMLSDENKALLQGEMETFVKDAAITSQQRQLFAQESSRLIGTTQEQIATISRNDSGNMNANQQQAAIQNLLNQQDAQLKLLKDLMINSTSWQW